MIVPVALAPVQSDSPVELVALTLDADISESEGHTLVTGNSTFKLHNTDRLNDIQLPVGFPVWAGDPYAFDPTQLASFAVSLDGRKVRLNTSRADLKIGNAVRTVDWYTFTLPMAGDQKRIVRIDFQQDLGDGPLPRFAYGLVTASGWKGSIGSARLTLRFPETTSQEQIVAYDPANTSFDGSAFSWHFQNHEPPVNPTLTILRPSLWDDLLARRRAAQQNPNDPSARAALGELLASLAALDSPRQDSYSEQAIAELETAARLDPANREARQTLAEVYDARAGPPAGPRQAAYVLLAAAQWEALSAEGNARKQLAEDYFYLGIDAQTRGEFAEALSYYDKAASLAPSGAGPLFTAEHASAQRKSLGLAWARSLADQGDYADAVDKARGPLGEAFVTSLDPPLFYASRVQVTMAAHARIIVVHLVPFAMRASDLQNALAAPVDALRGAGADSSLSSDGGELVLTVTVPFDSSTELARRLDAMAQSLPDRPEWALVRVVVSPDSLSWDQRNEVWRDSTTYREEADLSAACAPVVAKIDALNQQLAPLDSAPATDEEAQLKRLLLKNAQSGWQQALASGQVVYQSGSNAVRVDACTAQTISWSSAALRIEGVAILAAATGLFSAGVLFVGWKRIVKGRRETHGS